MKFSFEAQTTLKAEEIWQNYANVDNWFTWEDDLLAIHLDGEFVTGSLGEMTLEGMPPMKFELIEVTENQSFCDETKIPNLGAIRFNHELIGNEAGTIVRHSVEFISLDVNEESKHLEFISQVFSDVPASIFALIKASSKA